MSRFDECLKFVLEREGGYCDHPSDRGCATNKGITQRVYDEFRNSRGWPMQPVKFILPDEVASIYRSRYWDVCLCDRLPKPIDLVVFDGAVNHGPKQSAKFLQRAVGADDDGFVGQKTIDAVVSDVKAGMLETVFNHIIAQREYFYDQLVKRDPTQTVFRNGWQNRLNELKSSMEVA